MTEIINSFPGYEFIWDDNDRQYKNMYRGTNIGRGGYIISDPGIYGNVALLDIESLHPNSIRAMNCFGEYTKNFTDILDARVHIKHGEYDEAKTMLDGRLAPYLEDKSTAKNLAQALKIAINSVYGLTSASFDNPFRDPRNKNNIVALRGALFMRTLQDEVESRGFKIVAIKTDSIKIADATLEIIEFCMEFAKSYGYKFVHESTYDRMCQINDADYIAKYKDVAWCEQHYGYVPKENQEHEGEWTATGAQFAVPFIFKTLFSKEPIEFDDMCETKSVKEGAIFLDMNEGLGNTEELEKEMVKLQRKLKKAHDTDDPYLADLMDQEADLKKAIDDSHNLKFVGRVGQFCPIKPGRGGGILYRVNEGKNFAVAGTKGYRWLESEVIREQGREDDIDISYYRKLVDEAADTIKQYGDVNWFTSDAKYEGFILDSLPDFEPLPEMLDIKKDYNNYY